MCRFSQQTDLKTLEDQIVSGEMSPDEVVQEEEIRSEGEVNSTTPEKSESSLNRSHCDTDKCGLGSNFVQRINVYGEACSTTLSTKNIHNADRGKG